MDLRVVHTLEIGTNLQNAIRLPNGKFVVSDLDGQLFLIDNKLEQIIDTYKYKHALEAVFWDESYPLSVESSDKRHPLFDKPCDLLYIENSGNGFICVADTNCIKKIDLNSNGDPDQQFVETIVETSSTPFGLVLLHDNSLLFCVLRTIFHLSRDLKTLTKIRDYETTYEIQALTLLPDGNVCLALYDTDIQISSLWKFIVTTPIAMKYFKSYRSGTLITSITSIQSSVAKPAIVTIGSRTNETSTTEFIGLQQVPHFALLPIHIHAKEQFKIRSFLQLSESDFLAVCSNKLAIMGVRDAGSMNVAFQTYYESPLSQDVYDHVQSFLPAAVAKEGGGGAGAGGDEPSGSGNGKPDSKRQKLPKLEHAYHAHQLQLRFNRALKW